VALVCRETGHSTFLIASSARRRFDAADFCTIRPLFCLVAGPEAGYMWRGLRAWSSR